MQTHTHTHTHTHTRELIWLVLFISPMLGVSMEVTALMVRTLPCQLNSLPLWMWQGSMITINKK